MGRYTVGNDSKTVQGHTTYFLWQQNQLDAEINADGKISTQYLYFNEGQTSTPIAKLDDDDITSQHFTLILRLRLPGQYEDNETGLYYNRQRYYAPSLGQYLSPDPAGNPDGPNGYSYVRNNPLKYIDPDGLILFAFDGTGNTNDQPWLTDNGSSFSNVWQFDLLYNDGNRRYVTGVGTIHKDKQYGDIYAPVGDMGFNFSGVARINRMVQYFNDEADEDGGQGVMDVDIIGFSRGASEARDFATQIVAHSKKDTEGNYWYSYKDNADKAHCQQVKFRFMGLWDTVLSTNAGRAYNLAIPDQFTYVAQAVALNEYRGDTFHPYGSIGAFPLESIMQGQSSPVPTPGATRIEMGFIGAHADIGGGFAEGENQLPQVALAWMVKQARDAGVTMYDPSSSIISNPVIHDKSDSIKTGAPEQNAEDRQIHYRDGLTSTQREITFTSGMSYADTQQNNLINYLAKDDPARKNFVTGRVDMKAYLEWLRSHGYDLGDLQVQE
ncbi:RHS repeat-associated core domain-containing protein [Undibacterium sp. Ji67W]|uniref:RHS repeat-associated core domain-containing protein n=1 Tax=Undibacterium sp. Ji67W TaxID=3413042 RepID=UPI003BEF57E1